MKTVYTFFIIVFPTFFMSAQAQYFPPQTGSAWDTISPQSLNWCQNRIDSLYNYLDTNNTRAFILLKDGKIVLEKYFDTHTQNSLWQWASAGKTITSVMVGIAQQENYLSIVDTTSTYLGQGWTSCLPAQEEKINIWNQLTMTSGLDDGLGDPYCTDDTCLVYLADAGTRWSYHNAPYTLLDSVIENATGMTLNAYTTQKLKTPIGMTGAFIPVGYNNVYFSNARSMARFGLLILNNGTWNGTQIMTDTSYFHQMVNTSQSLNLSYGYLWWLNGKSTFMVPGTQFVFNGPLSPNAPADMFVAMGKDGQFLNIVPSQNMVWLRMGNSPDGFAVPYQLNDKIWEYINELECSTTGVNDTHHEQNMIQVFPNHSSESLHIHSSGIPIVEVELYNVQGQIIKSLKGHDHVLSISIRELKAGLYFVKSTLSNGIIHTGKWIKEK